MVEQALACNGDFSPRQRRRRLKPPLQAKACSTTKLSHTFPLQTTPSYRSPGGTEPHRSTEDPPRSDSKSRGPPNPRWSAAARRFLARRLAPPAPSAAGASLPPPPREPPAA